MKRINSRIATGVLIVLAGVLFLLSNINLLSFGDVFSTWWPLLLVAAGAVTFINNPRSYVSALVVVSIGVFLLLDNLGILSVNVWQVIWPVIIIAIGISIMANRFKGPHRSGEDHHDMLVFMSGSEEKNNSQDYRGGKVSAILGGSSIDLRKATIKSGATLEVFVICGGIELFLPEGIVVDKKLTHIMGGTEDKTSAPVSKNAVVLHIVGTVALGGIEIKN